jgi:hypothetical protein
MSLLSAAKPIVGRPPDTVKKLGHIGKATNHIKGLGDGPKIITFTNYLKNRDK